MNIEAYGCYTIQNVRRDPHQEGYLHIPAAAIDAGRTITVWSYDGRGVDFTDHFEFVTVPTPGSDNAFYLVNRRSGLPLRVCGDHVVQGMAADQKPEETSDQAAEFLFEPVDDAFRISSRLTGTYLTTQGFGLVNSTPLGWVDPVLKAGTDDAVRQFRLVQVASLMGEPPKPATTKGGRFTALTGLDTDLPDQTAPVLREVEVVPFFAVTDPLYPAHRQVQVTPHYTLELSRLWTKVFDRQLDGIVQRETEETTETGLTTLDAESVMSTLSWSVGVEGSMKYKTVGFSASMKLTAQLAGETKKATSSSTERRLEHLVTETILYPAIGTPYRLVRWRPVDRYELHRKDRSLVDSWNVVRTEEEVIDVFPRGVVMSGTGLSTTEADRSRRAQSRRQAVSAG